MENNEKKTETPLIDLMPRLYTAVKKSQMILAAWLLPDSTISDSEYLTMLLGVLDDNVLVKEMKEAMGEESSEKA